MTEMKDDKNQFVRTSKEQIDCYMRFLQKYPTIHVNKNGMHSREKEALWQHLSAQLNALKGPTRSAAKWRESLVHWKNQKNSRVRKLMAQKTAEESCLQEVLIPMEQTNSDIMEEEGLTSNIKIEENSLMESGEPSNYSTSEASIHSNSFCTEQKIFSSDMFEKIIRVLTERNEEQRRRNEEERQHRNETIKCMEKLSDAMNNIATALLTFSKAFENNKN